MKKLGQATRQGNFLEGMVTSKNFRFKCFATTSRAAEVGMLLKVTEHRNLTKYNYNSREAGLTKSF